MTNAKETFEREEAIKRGGSNLVHPTDPVCAPDVPGLAPDLIYSLVAENVRDYAIFLLDAEGVIRCWGESARLMKWWTKQQAEGGHLRMLYPDGGSEDGTAEEHLLQAAESGEYTGEGHRVRADGSTFWAYVTLTALRNAQGVVAGFTKVTRDFSARRAVESALIRDSRGDDRAHEKLEEAGRMKQAIANLSHELRTPLTAILGSVSLLTARLDASDENQAHLERLRRSSQHLLAIADDVLEVARTESGRLPLASAARRMGAAIEDALADVETQAHASGLTLQNSVSGAAADLPYWGDEGRVRQIIVNLLSNAVKFTDPGGRITISGGTGLTVAGSTLTGEGPWVYVRVEDTGRGIPPENLEKIFEPFEQADAADQQRGAGLGLAISRELARAMGGDLVAESELGKGSRFTLWLPIKPAEPIPR